MRYKSSGSFAAFAEKLLKELDKALEAGNHQVAEDMRKNVPSVTGKLKGNIEEVKVKECHHRTKIDSPYAVDVEFGNAHQAAEPFGRPAFDKNADNIQNILENTCKKS